MNAPAIRQVPESHRVAAACWLPPELREVIDAMPGGSTLYRRRYDHDDEHMEVVFERLSSEALGRVVAFLRQRRREVLARRSVREIVEVLDRAAARWLDPAYPPRQGTIAEISFITGFSPEMVAHAIEEEQVSSQGPHLLEALRNELGDPEFLDGFRPNPRTAGLSRALGPGLVGAIFSSNIPALPHLEIMRSFLVKSACLGRVSAGEPIFLRRYAETLYELDPDLASCLAIIYWERGDDETESLFLRSIDYIVAYGGDAQIERLMARRPPTLDGTWHGHRLGFTYVTREALAAGQDVRKLARSISYDFTIFDGFACLCPQVVLVEDGGETSPLQLARLCAEEMARWVRLLPPRRLDLANASRKQSFAQLCMMNDAMEVIAAPLDGSYLVTLGAMQRLEPTGGDRYLRMVPVGGQADLERLVGPLPRQHLQCAAIAAGGAAARHHELRELLASWGTTRIVPPGIMGRPSMMWHHDGVACLGRMVTWCDHELVVPELLLGRDPLALISEVEADPSATIGAALT
ncbi:MAG TPA: acyl-CoA reductase [Kofleriaceae bacterium]